MTVRRSERLVAAATGWVVTSISLLVPGLDTPLPPAPSRGRDHPSTPSIALVLFGLP
jgi:hypothetical protein